MTTTNKLIIDVSSSTDNKLPTMKEKKLLTTNKLIMISEMGNTKKEFAPLLRTGRETSPNPSFPGQPIREQIDSPY